MCLLRVCERESERARERTESWRQKKTQDARPETERDTQTCAACWTEKEKGSSEPEPAKAPTATGPARSKAAARAYSICTERRRHHGGTARAVTKNLGCQLHTKTAHELAGRGRGGWVGGADAATPTAFKTPMGRTTAAEASKLHRRASASVRCCRGTWMR